MATQNIQQSYALALEHHNAGRMREAEMLCRQILSQRPDIADVHNILGAALQGQNRIKEAASAFTAATSLRPEFAAAHYNLGTVLRLQEKLDEGITALRRALELDPKFFEAWNNLGNALEDTLLFDQAADAYRQAVRLRPDSAEAIFNLGNALRDMADPDGAIDAYTRAIRLKADYVEAKHNLAAVLKDTGRLDEAIEIWQRLLDSHPAPFIASNYIYSLHFHPDYDAKRLYDSHAQWNERYARHLAPARLEYPNVRDPARRLRIGYVSPDLREHPVGRFLLPLLANHDRAQFEIFCNTDVRHADSVTEQLRGHTNAWRSTIGLSDEQLSQLIRQDQIDILVDLTMHMKGSRLLAFARKPAPVQVTYLAYCSTTGLETMDYRLTDPYLDPSDKGDTAAFQNRTDLVTGEGRVTFYSERSVRLPRTYWCYQPSPDAPPVGELPFAANGFITFGCLNNFNKVTPGALDAWGEILRRVPNSRLLLFAAPGSHRRRAADRLKEQAIDPQRLEFISLLPLPRYLAQYNRIDIALDPFPYPGGTTTCDALWMGVPVVSLIGQTAVSRAGLSILSNIALGDLVADSVAGYVEIARRLASDPSRLGELRNSLRRRMKASPLMDAPGFARDVEAAFRQMWKTWCQSPRQ